MKSSRKEGIFFLRCNFLAFLRVFTRLRIFGLSVKLHRRQITLILTGFSWKLPECDWWKQLQNAVPSSHFLLCLHRKKKSRASQQKMRGWVIWILIWKFVILNDITPKIEIKRSKSNISLINLFLIHFELRLISEVLSPPL